MLYYGKIFFLFFLEFSEKFFQKIKNFFFNPLQYLYTKIKLTLYKNPLAILQKPPKNQAVKKIILFFQYLEIKLYWFVGAMPQTN